MKIFFVSKVILLWSPLMMGGMDSTTPFASRITGYRGLSLIMGKYCFSCKSFSYTFLHGVVHNEERVAVSEIRSMIHKNQLVVSSRKQKWSTKLPFAHRKKKRIKACTPGTICSIKVSVKTLQVALPEISVKIVIESCLYA